MTRDGVRHSRPFFTRAVTSLELGDPGRLPWQLPVTRAILRHWAASETFQASYLESLLHDLLHPEVTALSSVHLAVSRISGEGGEDQITMMDTICQLTLHHFAACRQKTRLLAASKPPEAGVG